jgi:hypothetical protein
VTLLLLALVVGFAVALYLVYRREPETTDEPGGRFADAVDLSLADLERITEPRAAVIACYGHMLAAASASGASIKTSDAPLEALSHILRKAPLTEANAARLTKLFEHAKFSDHLVDEATRTQAQYILHSIRAELSGQS